MRVLQHEGHHSRLAARLLLILFLALAVLATSGCATRGGPVPYEPENFGAPDAEGLSVSPTVQRISPLDKVKVSVFQVDDLSGDFQVDKAGNIDFPLIGTVPAQGRTTTELAQLIAENLGKRYLKSPNVQVSLTETSEQTITVDGSVKQPGEFRIKGTTTLMRAIALARGAAEDANLSRVIVFRTVNGERVAGAFDLKSIRRAQMADPVLYGNDIVIVDGSRARALYRELLGSINLIRSHSPQDYQDERTERGVPPKGIRTEPGNRRADACNDGAEGARGCRTRAARTSRRKRTLAGARQMVVADRRDHRDLFAGCRRHIPADHASISRQGDHRGQSGGRPSRPDGRA
jgi:polysaccharide export outer membrane protein